MAYRFFFPETKDGGFCIAHVWLQVRGLVVFLSFSVPLIVGGGGYADVGC